MMVSKAGNMIEVETGNKLIASGRQKQSEAQGRLEDISKERIVLKTSFLKRVAVKKNKNMFKSMYKLTTYQVY